MSPRTRQVLAALALLVVAARGTAQSHAESAFTEAATWTVVIRASVSLPFIEDE